MDQTPEKDGAGANAGTEAWERKVLEKVAMAGIAEMRAKRRWGIFFKLTALCIVMGVVFLMPYLEDQASKNIHGAGKHTAIVELRGEISSDGPVSADKVIKGLNDAFNDHGTQGVILRINSPGGSPVQSGYIYDEIRRLRASHPNIPVYAVVEDICASGGYYVASAADKIYVNKASIVGSIGVIMGSFGFTGVMEKIGVERRLLTAGENKGFLDPFSPANAVQQLHAKEMLAEIHQQFIDAVKQGRGARLKETPDMFTGLVWTGAKSIDLGLADGVGSASSVARDVIKVSKTVDFTEKEGVAERVAKKFGVGAASAFSGVFTRATGVEIR